MVKIRANIDDWDTLVSLSVILPMNLRSSFDTSHDLQVTFCQGNLPLGRYDDPVKFCSFLDELNAEYPDMDTDTFLEIFDKSGAGSLDDAEFLRKIADGDFMLSEVEIESIYNNTPEERCAFHLSTWLEIPFAKDITDKDFKKMRNQPEKVLWNKVWNHYKNMGFHCITSKDKTFAFHWGNAEHK